METAELLKKLKSIKPDADHSRKSRMVILSSKENRLPAFSFSFKEAVAGVLRSSWSMALTAVLLLLAIGSFSILKILSPATNAVVDLTGLKAEAQAIDAQIEFTNIVYNSSVGIQNKTSTVNTALPEKKLTKPAKQTSSTVIKPGTAGSQENAPAEITIDSVLDLLSQ